MGDSGILVDLQRLNQIAVSSDNMVARVGPEARWGDIQAAVGAHKVSVVGGRTPSVGVGGLVLGGMYDLLASRCALPTLTEFRWLLSPLATIRPCCRQCEKLQSSTAWLHFALPDPRA